MKSLMLALVLVSGFAQAEVVMNATDSAATYESIKASAQVVDSNISTGYKKIQQGDTTCYLIPNREANVSPFTITCVKN